MFLLWCAAISGFYAILTFISYVLESIRSKNWKPSPEHKRVFIFCVLLSLAMILLAYLVFSTS